MFIVKEPVKPESESVKSREASCKRGRAGDADLRK